MKSSRVHGRTAPVTGSVTRPQNSITSRVCRHVAVIPAASLGRNMCSSPSVISSVIAGSRSGSLTLVLTSEPGLSGSML